MAKCCNLVVNYDAIFGMTVVSVQAKGIYNNPSSNKAKVKKMVPNNSKAFHLRRPKLT
ncbi:MAG: hypothetical protein ACM3O4_05915 [Ignavibacteriales bacterium]